MNFLCGRWAYRRAPELPHGGRVRCCTVADPLRIAEARTQESCPSHRILRANRHGPFLALPNSFILRRRLS